MSNRCPNCGALENALKVAEDNEKRLRAEIEELKAKIGPGEGYVVRERDSKYDISYSNQGRVSYDKT